MTARSMIICDDEAALAAEIGEFFEAHNWRVQVCVSASAARNAMVRGFGPTCLLTDLRLEQESGADLIGFARSLPAALSPQVFALVTGHATDPEAAGRFGADLLYFKPVDPFAILADLDCLTGSLDPRVG